MERAKTSWCLYSLWAVGSHCTTKGAITVRKITILSILTYTLTYKIIK